MSDKSEDNSNEEKSDSNWSRTQTPISDQNVDNDYTEDISGLTFASLLQTHCSFPTELFHTLSPISLSQITSESTPIVTNRCEPIGGEDLRHQRQTLLKTFANQLVDTDVEQVVEGLQTIEQVSDRPPLIGQTNSTSDSSRSTTVSVRQESDESIGTQVMTLSDRDFLASKVRQLLGRTKRQSDESEVESLELIHTINETLNENTSYATIDSERSEPDGKGKPFSMRQTAQKLVYYSSSESEDEEEVSDSSVSTSNASQKRVLKCNENIEKSVRNRSYSASGRTALKSSGFDISAILRKRLQTKDISVKESSETQTSRSFLAEQAVLSQRQTRVKRTGDASKAIQTSDSLLSIASNEVKKELKESGSQTTNDYISSFLRQFLKSKQNAAKVSAGTQTLRSYLTEQALKHTNREQNRKQNKYINRKSVETKAIQTSYSSSHNSGTDSPIIVDKSEQIVCVRKGRKEPEDSKEPISWFIPIDKKSKNKNVSQISRTYSRNSRMKSKPKESIGEHWNPVPLQEAFNRHCIDMRTKSQIRVNRINTIADIRKRTADQRLIEMAKQFIRQQESAKCFPTNIIQPVFKSSIRRFFTHEEMRAQTEKVYKNLPEVKAMQEKKKQKEREKNQRLLAQIYKYRLKDNALKGRMTWKITQSCLN